VQDNILLIASGLGSYKVLEYMRSQSLLNHMVIYCFRKEKYEPLLECSEYVKAVENEFSKLLSEIKVVIKDLPKKNTRSFGVEKVEFDDQFTKFREEVA
jgi:uncharacterized protein YcsI (UPF0317 family)